MHLAKKVVDLKKQLTVISSGSAGMLMKADAKNKVAMQKILREKGKTLLEKKKLAAVIQALKKADKEIRAKNMAAAGMLVLKDKELKAAYIQIKALQAGLAKMAQAGKVLAAKYAQVKQAQKIQGVGAAGLVMKMEKKLKDCQTTALKEAVALKKLIQANTVAAARSQAEKMAAASMIMKKEKEMKAMKAGLMTDANGKITFANKKIKKMTEQLAYATATIKKLTDANKKLTLAVTLQASTQKKLAKTAHAHAALSTQLKKVVTIAARKDAQKNAQVKSINAALKKNQVAAAGMLMAADRKLKVAAAQARAAKAQAAAATQHCKRVQVAAAQAVGKQAQAAKIEVRRAKIAQAVAEKKAAVAIRAVKSAKAAKRKLFFLKCPNKEKSPTQAAPLRKKRTELLFA